jgi:aspartyl/asparaginyl-tRNA synthetase
MVQSALGDPSGGTDLSLADGQPLQMVKLVGAVRQHEEMSRNVFIDVKDGTGLVQVKVWVNEGDKCSMASSLRQDASTNHTYVHVIGQVREFNKKRTTVQFGEQTYAPPFGGRALVQDACEDAE